MMPNTTVATDTTAITAATTNNSPNNRRDADDYYGPIVSVLYNLGKFGSVLGLLMWFVGFIVFMYAVSHRVNGLPRVEPYFTAGLSICCSGIGLFLISFIPSLCTYVNGRVENDARHEHNVENGEREQNNNSLVPVPSPTLPFTTLPSYMAQGNPNQRQQSERGGASLTLSSSPYQDQEPHPYQNQESHPYQNLENSGRTENDKNDLPPSHQAVTPSYESTPLLPSSILPSPFRS